ncbi:MAG: dihydroorotase [Lentisphaerae bacterium]|nr:dihydroorotase [Lentisphaerota bacterium]
MTSLTLPLADDLHVHLRQGDVLRTVVPLLRAGGAGRVLVMPNTTPPVTSAGQAVAYRAELRAVAPDVDFLMTLYFTPALTPDEVRRAAAAGVVGIKVYPHGVTTNSASGVEDLLAFGPVLAAMEAADLVLELHGELPAHAGSDVCVLDAEERFLPTLRSLHDRYPRLRIVLEHVTTARAVDAVKSLGATVAATITAHHLDLMIDDWAGKNHNFCKPVAKYPSDRAALRAVVGEGHPRFFLGSDSAPHPRTAKECASACAGVFTSPLLLAYLADTFEGLGALDRLPAFASEFGCRFYRLPPARETIRLVREPQVVPPAYGGVVPYRAGATLNWRIAAA